MRSVEVVGLRVDVVGIRQVVDELIEWTDRTDRVRVAVGVNAHVCNMAAKDAMLRDFVRAADLAYADGQSIVWAGRVFGAKVPERVATTDIIFPLSSAAAAAGRRIFFYGSAPGVAERAAARLVAIEPDLQIEVANGFIPKSELAELVQRINDFGTDLLFVGLGDPLQQQWIEEWREDLRVPVVLTCGGLFDWTSGNNRRPPEWMVKAGLEWLWRVLIEPRRLARRYLLGNPVFIYRLLGQYLRERRAG